MKNLPKEFDRAKIHMWPFLAEFHLDDEDTAPRIIVECPQGYVLVGPVSRVGSGDHGWLQPNEEMKSILIALGPHLKANTNSFSEEKNRTEEMRDIDVYRLMGHVLGIELPASSSDGKKIIEAFSA